MNGLEGLGRRLLAYHTREHIIIEALSYNGLVSFGRPNLYAVVAEK